MCKHRFGVQLLQNPPCYVAAPKNGRIMILNCLKKIKLLTLTSCTADEAKSTVYFRLFLPLVAPQRPRGPEALCVCVEASLPRWGAEAASMFFFLSDCKEQWKRKWGRLKWFQCFFWAFVPLHVHCSKAVFIFMPASIIVTLRMLLLTFYGNPE